MKKPKQVESEYHRNYHLKRRYGITVEEYDELLEAQGHRCKICRTDDPGGRNARFHVDHCHTTNKVRGLLCSRCNQAIGLFDESVLVLESAIKYLNEKSN